MAPQVTSGKHVTSSGSNVNWAQLHQGSRPLPRAIPQYEIGHLARIRAALASDAATRPGLTLAGNYLDGVAFNKAAKCGYAAGQNATSVLSS